MAKQPRKSTKVSRKVPAPPAARPQSTEKDLCFVLMPFGGWFDQYYDGV